MGTLNKNPFNTFAKLQAQGIRVFVVGGYAVNAHGYTRVTMDADCLIVTDDLRKADAVFREDGFVMLRKEQTHARYINPDCDPKLVDVLLVDLGTFDKMWAHRIPCAMSGHALHIPILEHLFAMKLHAVRNQPDRSSKDMLDIHELMKANPAVVSREQMVDLCRKFGPPDRLEQIQEIIFGNEHE
jgi:hypothetical protein